MNVLLIGNGFDLHHDFPTTYLNFMNLTQFLVEHFNRAWETVGDVFKQSELQALDESIKKAYHTHCSTYNSTPLDIELIEEIIAFANDNMWFNYFKCRFNKTLGWIDFETEIGRVITTFQSLFLEIGEGDVFDINLNKLEIMNNSFNKYILSKFDFFIKSRAEQGKHDIIDSPYLISDPPNYGTLIINKEKIINELYSSLQDFSRILVKYLQCFVEAPTKRLADKEMHPSLYWDYDVTNIEYVVSFNYTNTYKLLYKPYFSLPSDNEVLIANLHGNISSNIILGVNPDIFDELESADTDFIQFKKYYQRVYHKTDTDYLSLIDILEDRTTPANPMDLYVMGHSLDKTDEDIIKTVFELASTITIYYHNDNAVGTYVKKLISIYGKKEFDAFRLHKKLRFFEYPPLTWGEGDLPF